MQRPPLPTPNRNRVRPQQTPTSHQRGLVRFSTPKASPRRSPAPQILQSNNGTVWETYGLDENSLTIRFLYSNLLLLGIECSSIFCRYRTGQQQQQISMDELSNSTELIRLVTHFLLLTYLSDAQQTQYLRDTTHCFPPMAIDKQQEFNRIVKQHFKLLSETYQQYPWPQLIPVPSCSPRYFICLFYLSQLCLIHRLEPTDVQERFLTNENFQNIDLTKERLKRQIRMIKADTQRHYMMFFSKIANEKRERIEYEKTKYELDERIHKLINYLEKIKQKTEIIDGSFDQSQIIDENQFEIFSNLVRDLHRRINSDIYNKLEWFTKHNLSTSLPSMGVDIGLLPNICQQVHAIVNKQENISNRISQLYPRFSEKPSSSSSTSTTVTLNDVIQAANICLEKRLTSHSVSDENFAKLKLALEQMNTTIERTEQVHKTLDHLKHLPKHISRYDNDQQMQKTPFDHIVTKFYSSIDCGQQAREIFRDQMSKQTPNSFVTCCNTIATISGDDSNSDFMNDDTTIIRCQLSAPLPPVPETEVPMTDEGMLKGLECLLLSEPMPISITTHDDESFLTLEQECKIDSEIFIDRPRRKTIVETNVAAVIMDDKMEDDYSQKENITPQQQQQQQQMNEIHIDKLDNDIHFISPIMSVPIGQQQPVMPKLLEQIDTIDPY
ncbi:unnamed protein product [Rotaria sp. Silwood1]|nr:unnamed protein product [Rotaria sp. Silwood1]CAF1280198.1 unnamed protein product [Rotaria sp. Silwood1]CAF3534878.1 unnamed protein product [Rotaria sp. Silwood1]CAF4598144.1 unnamed protein product [Rotaria sp. Silwood1]